MIGVYKDDYNYADSRLNGTVVRLNGEGFYVLSVHRGGTVAGKMLKHLAEDGKHMEVHVMDLDVSSPPLGFVNYEGYACYVVRIPRRDDWRQGLRSRSLKSLTGINMRDMSLRHLTQCIEDVYPTLEEARVMAKDRHSVAWHRHWAIAGDGELFYRSMGVVGSMDGGLEMEYDFLQGELEDAL